MKLAKLGLKKFLILLTLSHTCVYQVVQAQDGAVGTQQASQKNPIRGGKILPDERVPVDLQMAYSVIGIGFLSTLGAAVSGVHAVTVDKEIDMREAFLQAAYERRDRGRGLKNRGEGELLEHEADGAIADLLQRKNESTAVRWKKSELIAEACAGTAAAGLAAGTAYFKPQGTSYAVGGISAVYALAALIYYLSHGKDLPGWKAQYDELVHKLGLASFNPINLFNFPVKLNFVDKNQEQVELDPLSSEFLEYNLDRVFGLRLLGLQYPLVGDQVRDFQELAALYSDISSVAEWSGAREQGIAAGIIALLGLTSPKLYDKLVGKNKNGYSSVSQTASGSDGRSEKNK